MESAESEEVVLLLVGIDWPLVDRAQVAWEQFVVGVVLLAGDAVFAAVGAEFDVAGVVAALQQFEHSGFMARFGRADEVVVGDVQPVPGVSELGCDRIGERLRIEPGGIGGLLDFLTMFVRSGQELDVVTHQSVPTCQCITDDRRVGVPQVGLGIHVVDRCCDVDPAHASTLPNRQLEPVPGSVV